MRKNLNRNSRFLIVILVLCMISLQQFLVYAIGNVIGNILFVVVALIVTVCLFMKFSD